MRFNQLKMNLFQNFTEIVYRNYTDSKKTCGEKERIESSNFKYLSKVQTILWDNAVCNMRDFICDIY